ncbi:guanine nucleotide-binding protein subunit alpha-11-like isoform X2 [Sycon ciliatum]|uniref:guanine nucleotide-binding protein subunit alpha-11-like isoform X2 n=1 Tax=Sycon ciliatum TaxID=27933 RepID=UPI0031F60613
MACCASNGGDPDSKKRSDDIDKMLIAQRDTLRRTVKVLLLGAGESGKSTFLKQMRIIHGEDFKEADCEEFRSTIYTNIMKAGKVLIQARELLSDPEIPWGDEGNARHADLIAAAPSNVEQYSDMAPYFAALEELWLDSGIQATFARRSQFHIGDSTEYFFKQIKTLSSPEYLPSKQDVLCSRKATRGIHEYDLAVKKVPFKFVDVGGQRSQRTKWFQCFDDVESVFFFTSANDLYEDAFRIKPNGDEYGRRSREMFEELVVQFHKFHGFADKVIFFTKVDLMDEKVKAAKDAGGCLEGYRATAVDDDSTGLGDREAVCAYLKKSMCTVELREMTDISVYAHFVNTTDTDLMDFVFEAARSTMFQWGLSRRGMGPVL